MILSLEHRLKQVFPTGILREIDTDQLGQHSQRSRVMSALDKACRTAPLNLYPEGGNQYSYCYGFTHRASPEFNAWIWSMDNEEKIQWIKGTGKPYVVLWLRISRIADFYYAYFNHWIPRGDTGYVDADLRQEPDAGWQGYADNIFSALHEQGFQLAKDEFLRELVPFILARGGDGKLDDDPRLNDADFDPPPALTTIYECLFGSY